MKRGALTRQRVELEDPHKRFEDRVLYAAIFRVGFRAMLRGYPGRDSGTSDQSDRGSAFMSTTLSLEAPRCAP